MVLTVVFEFALGRYVVGDAWGKQPRKRVGGAEDFQAAVLGLHRHQQREFVFLRELPRRLQFRFRHIVRINACQPDPGAVDAHHDLKSFGLRLVEDRFEHPDDEVLGGVVVIVQEDPP